jgi:hypothetical protein
MYQLLFFLIALALNPLKAQEPQRRTDVDISPKEHTKANVSEGVEVRRGAEFTVIAEEINVNVHELAIPIASGGKDSEMTNPLWDFRASIMAEAIGNGMVPVDFEIPYGVDGGGGSTTSLHGGGSQVTFRSVSYMNKFLREQLKKKKEQEENKKKRKDNKVIPE